MNRSRRIVIEVAARAGVKASELAQMLDALPRDCEVFGIDRDYSTDTTKICVVSERFDETPEYQTAPVVYAEFKRNASGDGEFVRFVDRDGKHLPIDRNAKSVGTFYDTATHRIFLPNGTMIDLDALGPADPLQGCSVPRSCDCRYNGYRQHVCGQGGPT